MTVQSPDLISELLRGMRLSGVKYRRIQASAPFGVAFHQAPGKAQFHFVSHGSALLRMESGAAFQLSSGDALFIPGGNSHALLSDERATITPVSDFPSEPICSSVCAITCEPCPESENTIIFSGCMDFELGGMQPLIKAMPEVMMVSRLMSTWPEIHPLLAAMERESVARQAGYAGILARLADVVAALIVRGWVEGGCGKATGWVQVLRDPRLSRAIYAMHQHTRPELERGGSGKRSGHVPFRVRRTVPGRDGNHPGKISQRAEDATGHPVHSPRKSAD